MDLQSPRARTRVARAPAEGAPLQGPLWVAAERNFVQWLRRGGLRSRFVRQADQHFAQLAGPRDPLRKLESPRHPLGLEINTVRIAPGAAPVGVCRTQ
jgi:hypothetical protein